MNSRNGSSSRDKKPISNCPGFLTLFHCNNYTNPRLLKKIPPTQVSSTNAICQQISPTYNLQEVIRKAETNPYNRYKWERGSGPKVSAPKGTGPKEITWSGTASNGISSKGTGSKVTTPKVTSQKHFVHPGTGPKQYVHPGTAPKVITPKVTSQKRMQGSGTGPKECAWSGTASKRGSPSQRMGGAIQVWSGSSLPSPLPLDMPLLFGAATTVSDTKLVSMQDENKLRNFWRNDFSSIESSLVQKLPKFSSYIKNHCNANFRILHRLKEDGRQTIFMLNPEYHLKFLEENLSFLTKKPSRCFDLKISSSKSNYLSLETNASSLPNSKLHASLSNSLNLDENVSQCNVGHCNGDVKLLRNSAILKEPNIICPENPWEKQSCVTPSTIKVLKRPPHCNRFQCKQNLKALASKETIERLEKKKDVDHHFEFDVGGENIVSFICSPPNSQRGKQSSEPGSTTDSADEDSSLSSSKYSAPSFKSDSSKDSHYNDTFRNDTLQDHGKTKISQSNLSHLPTTSSVVSLRESKSMFNCSSLNLKLNEKHSERCINIFGSFNSSRTFNSDDGVSLKSHKNHETIMFRETALRGCYDIENILKESKSALPHVEMEVDKTTKAIFAAVRLQKENESIVSDTALSVIDICNSWIKLSAHFERQEFKHLLETRNIDHSILEEFAQWQSTSRLFVDRLIRVLKELSARNVPNSNGCYESLIPSRPAIAAVGSHLQQRKDPLSKAGQFQTPIPNTTVADTNVQERRWKQRRFLSERMDSERMAMENKKSSKLNFTPGGLKQKFSSTNDHKNYPILGRGEGDVNVNFDLSKVSMGSSNNCQLTQHGVSLFPSAPQRQNCYNSGFFEGNLSTPNGNLFNIGCETSSVPPANEMCASFGNPFALSMSNCFPVNIQQTMPVTSPLINNQFSHVNSNPYQNAVSSCLEKPKPNPILCTDLDFDGNLAKNSYMKPGQYAPPQKPPCIQKTVSNSVPISDIPIVGIPFLYTTQQSDSQQPSIELQTGYSKLKVSKCIEDTDNTLVSDNSMVGCFKESYLGNNVDDVSNLKSSEVSTTSHFLLDDNNWNGLIGDDMKVNNDFDISSPSSSGSSETDPSIIVELKNKSTDWLVDSLKKISLEGEQSLKSSAVEDKVQDQVERTNPSDGCNGQDKQSLQPQFALTHSTRDVTEQNKDGMVKNNPEKPSQLLKTNTEHYQKKPKKIKNGRESYNLADRRSHSSHGRPETMVFATSMSDKVTCQLEEILNCIWNTPAATLIEDGIRNEKEGARLELRVRSPLYFQAMRCKLSNRSYDTLDQALSDFHQYFIDIRSRNKGDKMCSDAVDALEQIFFDQVEKHFGLTYQALSQNGCHFGENTINKARKQKKTPRRF